MNERPRPARLIKDTPPDPERATITFIMSDKWIIAITPPRVDAGAALEEMAQAISQGHSITLHSPDGSVTVLNPAHVISMKLR